MEKGVFRMVFQASFFSEKRARGWVSRAQTCKRPVFFTNKQKVNKFFSLRLQSFFLFYWWFFFSSSGTDRRGGLVCERGRFWLVEWLSHSIRATDLATAPPMGCQRSPLLISTNRDDKETRGDGNRNGGMNWSEVVGMGRGGGIGRGCKEAYHSERLKFPPSCILLLFSPETICRFISAIFFFLYLPFSFWLRKKDLSKEPREFYGVDILAGKDYVLFMREDWAFKPAICFFFRFNHLNWFVGNGEVGRRNEWATICCWESTR